MFSLLWVSCKRPHTTKSSSMIDQRNTEAPVFDVWMVSRRTELTREGGGGWCFPVKSNSTWSHRLCSSASFCGWNTLNSSYTSDIHFTPERQLIPYILRWKGNINQTFACAFFLRGGDTSSRVSGCLRGLRPPAGYPSCANLIWRLKIGELLPPHQ